MRQILPVFLALALAASAAAQGQDEPFINDLSSPTRVIVSLYNAINRHEYLRAWSYFKAGAVPPYEQFRAGYARTGKVELRIGEVRSEGAAGSIHSAVPVALRARDADGAETVFTGCYLLTEVQPAMQETPPFRPIRIDGGKLAKSGSPFEEATGQCEEP